MTEVISGHQCRAEGTQWSSGTTKVELKSLCRAERGRGALETVCERHVLRLGDGGGLTRH